MFTTLKRLLAQSTNHKGQVTIILISGLLLAALSTQFAMLLKGLMDSLQDPNPQTLYRHAALIIGLAFIQALTRYTHLFATDTLIEKWIQNLRAQLQNKLLDLPLSYYNRHPQGTGGLMSRLFNDMMIMQNGFRYLVDIIREPISLIFLLSWLFYLNLQLTLIIFLILPILLSLLKSLSRSVSKYSKQGQEQMEIMSQFIKENLDGIRVIQSFTLEATLRQKLKILFDTFYDIRRTMYARIHMASPVSEFIAMSVGVGVVVAIAYQIQQGQASYGDFTSYLGALLMLNRPIKVIQESVVRLQEVKIAAQRLFEILDAPNPLAATGDTQPFPANFKYIHFQDVCFQYADRPILNHINLSIPVGTSVGCVGLSGSGKSTFVNLLARFYDPDQGRVLLDQVDIKNISLLELRKNIGMVTQDVFLFSGSIQDNILAGNPERPAHELNQLINTVPGVLDFTQNLESGLASPVGERGQLFSGGEKQRISILRAWFKNAPLLIFDEATSQLDANSELKIQEAMRHLLQGKTSFIVAHRLVTIKDCDLILVFENGQIVEQGVHGELMSQQGRYYQLASSQGL